LANSTDFIPYATQTGALVEALATYNSDPQTGLGQQDGIADPANANRAWRQGTTGVAALMQIIADTLDANVPDDGNLPNLIGQMWAGFLNNSSFPDTGAINALVAALPFGAIFPTSALQAGTLITLIPSVTNTGPSTLNWALTGPKSIKLPSGVDPDSGDIIAGTTVRLCYDGVHWEMVSTPGRLTTILMTATTSLTYFVNPVTGNDANSGLSTGAAWQTLNHAYLWLQQNINANGQTITINCAFPNSPTAYTTATFSGGITGIFNRNQLLIVGDTTNQECQISTSAAHTLAVLGENGAKFTISGFNLISTGTGGGGLQGASGAQITYSSMKFGAAGTYAVSGGDSGSLLQAVGTNQFLGNCISTHNASGLSTIHVDGTTITNGGITVSGGNFSMTDGGLITAASVTFNGSGIIGSRFSVQLNGMLDTAGGQTSLTSSYMPGTTTATQTTGGQFQ
jgi:hypothetical protein